jgi:hypothetical protein
VANWRAAAVIALNTVAVAATAASASTQLRLYSLPATEACLQSLPHAVLGLPPATPPVPPVLFFDRLSPHFITVVRGQLAAWYGHGDIYEGIKFSFFKSASSARSHLKSLAFLYGGKVIRNAVVAWDQQSVPGVSLRRTLLGCLRAAPPAGTTPAPRRGTPVASLATFAGHWGGHTRALTITSPGRGLEYADSGCCDREYEMTFQLLSVSGTLTRASATYRVTSFKRYHRYIPSVRMGQSGTLLLRNGIVTNELTQDYFCSDPAWGATGACGA